jgi:hypothetical protein
MFPARREPGREAARRAVLLLVLSTTGGAAEIGVSLDA